MFKKIANIVFQKKNIPDLLAMIIGAIVIAIFLTYIKDKYYDI